MSWPFCDFGKVIALIFASWCSLKIAAEKPPGAMQISSTLIPASLADCGVKAEVVSCSSSPIWRIILKKMRLTWPSAWSADERCLWKYSSPFLLFHPLVNNQLSEQCTSGLFSYQISQLIKLTKLSRVLRDIFVYDLVGTQDSFLCRQTVAFVWIHVSKVAAHHASNFHRWDMLNGYG